MDVAEVEAGHEEGAGVAGVRMVEAMVDTNMITKEVMVGMDTKVDMDIKVDMETREDMATTKVVMVVMVTTKVHMEAMKMEVGTTTGTEGVVVVAEDEATGAMVVLDMTEVAEAQVALAAGAMCEAVDEWVAAVGGATKTTRSRVGFANPLMRFCMALEKNQRKKKDKAFSMAVVLFLSPPRF